jgi:hypothetical protein
MVHSMPPTAGMPKAPPTPPRDEGRRGRVMLLLTRLAVEPFVRVDGHVVLADLLRARHRAACVMRKSTTPPTAVARTDAMSAGTHRADHDCSSIGRNRLSIFS